MEEKIDLIRQLLIEEGLDGMLIAKPENRRYISGFTGSTGFALITRQKIIFFTDFRYLDQAAAQCQGYEIKTISRVQPIELALQAYGLNRLGIEEDFITYGQYIALQEKLINVQLIPLNGALTKLRAIKSPEEIQCIQKAASIADLAYQYILDWIKPGVTELEVAFQLEVFMRQQGASGLSFETIVASGSRSALPHGVASSKTIQTGDLVTLDFGCIFEGYCSDMTRTFTVGKASDKQRALYEIVLEAQETALKAVKPGMTGKQLDQIARDLIDKHGYGEYFGHGLGHGVGLEIHELPTLNSLGHMTMAPGMIITIEPGIYLPQWGGIRIEDLVVVTETGYVVLSTAPKALIELNY